MNADQIEAIFAKPHDSSDLKKQLRVFPGSRIRVFDAHISFSFPRKIEGLPVLTRNYKVVGGEYIVIDMSLADHNIDVNIIQLITFSEEEGLYKMWTLVSDIDGVDGRSIVYEYNGVYSKDEGLVLWTQQPHPKEPGKISTCLMIIEGDAFKTTTVNYVDGKLEAVIEGVLVPKIENAKQEGTE